MSSDRPLEFFLDRSLEKKSAERLPEAGYVVHLIADFYPDDARTIGHAEWIAEGCRRGWVLLTNVKLEVFGERILAAMPAIQQAVARVPAGFWHVHSRGRIRRMWP